MRRHVLWRLIWNQTVCKDLQNLVPALKTVKDRNKQSSLFAVQEVLESRASVVPTVKAMTDLQALAGALLDSVNDKNLALSHQRKTNK